MKVEIQTIPNTARVQIVEYTPAFSVICSVGKAPFHGTIHIRFWPADHLLEFESFEGWLRSIANETMTIEDLTRKVFDELTDVLGLVFLSVEVHAETIVHGPVVATIERFA